MDDQQEELLTRLNYAVFGVRGNNGLLGGMESLRRDLNAYIAAEEARRKDDLQRERDKDRKLMFAAVSAAVGLLGTLVTLIVVLSTST